MYGQEEFVDGADRQGADRQGGDAWNCAMLVESRFGRLNLRTRGLEKHNEVDESSVYPSHAQG